MKNLFLVGAFLAMFLPSVAMAATYGMETADRTVSFDSSMTAAEIQAEIDLVGKHILPGVTITFQFADGTYDLEDQLTFQDFYGPGNIVIQGNTGEANATSLHTSQSVYLDFSGQISHGLSIYGVQVNSVKVKNLAIENGTSTTTAESAIEINNTTADCKVYYGYFVSASGLTRGVRTVNSRSTWVVRTYFEKSFIAINTFGTGMIMSQDNDDTGTLPTYGLYAEGGVIQKHGTQPNSSSGDGVNIGGAVR